MEQLSFWFTEMERLIGVPQNPVHHPEGDVWTHTLMVLDEAAKLRTEAEHPLGFMVTAMMHDLGKPECTTVEEDGRIRSIGHEKAWDTIESALDRITNIVKLKEYVHNMTELHMRPVALLRQNAGQKAYDKVFDQSVCPRDLVLFAKADHCGREGFSEYRKEEEMLLQKLAVFEELMARPYVMGRDLIEAGLEPGPGFGKLLAFAHKLRLAGVEKDSALRQTLALHRQTAQEEGKK